MKTKARLCFELVPFSPKLSAGNPKYWDPATRFELAMIARHEATGEAALAALLTAVGEEWEPEITARIFDLTRNARCSETVPWCAAIVKGLRKTPGNGAARRWRGLKHQPVIRKRM